MSDQGSVGSGIPARVDAGPAGRWRPKLTKNDQLAEARKALEASSTDLESLTGQEAPDSTCAMSNWGHGPYPAPKSVACSTRAFRPCCRSKAKPPSPPIHPQGQGDPANQSRSRPARARHLGPGSVTVSQDAIQSVVGCRQPKDGNLTKPQQGIIAILLTQEVARLSRPPRGRGVISSAARRAGPREGGRFMPNPKLFTWAVLMATLMGSGDAASSGQTLW